jgi:nucleoside-diphosphate-sugar epimerase
MGAVSRIVITGAGGYLGRACVAEARRRGLRVLAVHRGTGDRRWAADDGIDALAGDLTEDAMQGALRQLPDDVAVIHTAGHMGDDPAALVADTIRATQALPLRPGQRLVLVSSLSVYDTARLAPGDALTEDSPLIALPDGIARPAAAIRGADSPYAMSKRLQEALCAAWPGLAACWLLRPGAIWGPDRTWHALQGFRAGKLQVTIGSDGTLPLAHVESVAKAAVEAATRDSRGVEAINVFDDDCPTRARFLKAHRAILGWPRLNVTVPYTMWLAAIRPLAPVASRLPGLFREPILRARMMPLRFPNARLRARLGGEQPAFETLLSRAKATRP